VCVVRPSIKNPTAAVPRLLGFLVICGSCVVGGRTTTPAAEQNRAHDALEWREWVVHPDHLGDQVKVDEEENDSKENERKRSRNEEDAAHLEHKDHRGDETRLDLAANTTKHPIISEFELAH